MSMMLRLTFALLERPDGWHIEHLIDGKPVGSFGPWPCRLIAEIMRAEWMDNIEMELEGQ